MSKFFVCICNNLVPYSDMLLPNKLFPFFVLKNPYFLFIHLTLRYSVNNTLFSRIRLRNDYAMLKIQFSIASNLIRNMDITPENVVTYEQMKTFENKDSVLIIDVREPDEIKNTGKIGGSINIPVNSLNDLDNLSDEDFKQKYARLKPGKNFPLIFTCKSGRRATLAAGKIESFGFKNIMIYKGSWNEWQQRM